MGLVTSVSCLQSCLAFMCRPWIISARSGCAHYYGIIKLDSNVGKILSSFDFTINFHAGHDQGIQSRFLEIYEHNQHLRYPIKKKQNPKWTIRRI